MDKLFKIKDKVTSKTVAVYMGENGKAVARDLAFSGFFRANRVKDTELIECRNIEELEEYKKYEMETLLKELEIEFENKANETSPEDMKNKIKKTKKEAK